MSYILHIIFDNITPAVILVKGLLADPQYNITKIHNITKTNSFAILIWPIRNITSTKKWEKHNEFVDLDLHDFHFEKTQKYINADFVKNIQKMKQIL